MAHGKGHLPDEHSLKGTFRLERVIFAVSSTIAGMMGNPRAKQLDFVVVDDVTKSLEGWAAGKDSRP